MLIACSTCHRQYDVGEHPAGAKIRCFCGTLNLVPRRTPRQVAMAHCSNCGAAVKGEARACEYCEARIGLGERGWGESCPECFARMVKGARFCGACGIAIEVQAALQPLSGQGCPRCKTDLSACQREDAVFAGCTSCGGVWLAESALKNMLKQRQRESIAGALPSVANKAAEELPPLAQHEVRYLPCPVCSDRMNRVNFSTISGVLIDRCRDHGYWFDLHELEHIQRFVEDGGLERARARQAEARARVARRKGASGEALPLSEPSLLRAAARRRVGGWSLLDVLADILSTSLFD